MLKRKLIFHNSRSIERFIILFLLPIWTVVKVSAQDQNSRLWLKQIGGESWDISSGIAIDSKNDIFITGSFLNAINSGSISLKSTGDQDIFFAGLDREGDTKFLFGIGGKGADNASTICLTKGDNIIIGGKLTDSVNFGKIKIPGSGKKLFVASFDSTGNVNWVNTISIVDGDGSLFLSCADSDGIIFVSGIFSGQLCAGNNKIYSIGKKDIFIACLGPEGSIQRLYSYGSEGNDYPGSLAVDKSGNLALAGTLGRDSEKNSIKLSKSGTGSKPSCFISVFDREFKSKRVNKINGDDYINISSLKYDDSGNLFAAGSFSSELFVGDTTLFSNGYTDGFIIKYLPDGTLGWGKSFGSWYYDYASHVNIDLIGSVIISGTAGDTFTVDSIRIEPVSEGSSAIIVRISNNGEAIWADCIPGEGRSFGSGSVIDQQGNLYFTGSFRGKFKKQKAAVSSIGDQDIFVARYFNCPQGRLTISGKRIFCPGSATELSVKPGYSNVVWNDTIHGINSIFVSIPGPYSVKLRDKYGCLISDTIIVQHAAIPYFTLGNDTTIMVDDSLILKAPPEYPEYLWHDLSTGSDFIARSEGNKERIERYWLTVTDTTSCTYTDTIAVTFLKKKGNVGGNSTQPVVYPNPAHDRINWYLNAGKDGPLIIELSDGNGRVVLNQKISRYLSGEVRVIMLDKQPPGVYYFKVYDPLAEAVYTTVKILKQ